MERTLRFSPRIASTFETIEGAILSPPSSPSLPRRRFFHFDIPFLGQWSSSLSASIHIITSRVESCRRKIFGNILPVSILHVPGWCNFFDNSLLPFIYFPIFPHDLHEHDAQVTPRAGNMNPPIIYRIYIHDSVRFLKNPIKSAQSGQATLYYERVERPCTLFSDSPFRAIIQLASGRQSSPSLRSFDQQWSSLILRTFLIESSRVQTKNLSANLSNIQRIDIASYNS